MVKNTEEKLETRKGVWIMLNGLPGDPVMLLSVVNTKLRDQYHDLNVLCDDMNVAKEEIESKLNAIDYFYDSNRNQFV